MANKTLNPWYAAYALEHIIIDQDKYGLFCDILSESDPDRKKTCRVRVDGQNPTHCNCKAFEFHPERTCKHMEIAGMYYKKIYVEKLVTKQENKQSNMMNAALTKNSGFQILR